LILKKRGAVLFGLFLAAACRPPLPALIPPPVLRDVAGLATLKIVRAEGSARSKFGFAIAFPDRGRIDVLDPLGRTALQFLVEGDDAYLVLPSKRAYARGARGEVLKRFLGFPVELEELAGLLAGRWEKGGENISPGWILERDGRGRVSAGRRGDLSFAVLEFYPGGGVPRRVSFNGAGSEGTVTLHRAAFNGGLAPFSPRFRERFRAVSWEEIERLMGDEG